MSPDIVPAVLFLVKALVVLALIIYAIFAFVMVRQEHLMATVLEEKFEPVLRILTYIHLIASLATIVIALLIL